MKLKEFVPRGADVLLYCCRTSLCNHLKSIFWTGFKMPVCRHVAIDCSLFDWSTEDHTICIESLIRRGANVNGGDKDGNTHLIYASWRGNSRCVSALLRAGVDVNKTNNCGETALMFAAENRDSKCVELLIEAGANVNVMDTAGPHKFGPSGYGFTALMRAAYKGKDKCVNSLLKAGADASKYSNSKKFSDTALFFAVWKRHYMCAELLLKAGADVNGKISHGTNMKGCTPLHQAARNGDEKCLNLLLKAGANVHVKILYGGSALFETVERRFLTCSKALIQAGADGSKALFTAARCANARHVDVLLQIGMEVNTCLSDDGNSLLHELGKHAIVTVCESKGNFACLKLLLRAAIFINRSNNVGQNALERYVILRSKWHNNVDEETVKVFVSAGEEARGNFLFSHGRAFPVIGSMKQPKPQLHLMDMCRVAIQLDPPVNLFVKVRELGLPLIMTDYLLYGISVENCDYDDARWMYPSDYY